MWVYRTKGGVKERGDGTGWDGEIDGIGRDGEMVRVGGGW